MRRHYGFLSIAVGLFLVLSLFSVLPAVSAYAPTATVESHPNIGIGEPGNGAGHGGGGGGGGGHGGGGFTCPTISGADSSVCSTNWSGYVDSVAGGVTFVSGSWVVPAISCPSSGTTYVAIWVGIDGYTSSTVEQTGTLGECNNGVASYSAWYEFYPNPSVTISSITVSPGNTITASVSGSSGQFTTTITDGTQTNSTSGTVSGAAQNSAEWVVERPALCIGAHCVLTTLANFGSSGFTSASATVNAVSGSITSFNNVAITMIGGNSGPILAEPSSPTGDATSTSFSVTYG